MRVSEVCQTSNLEVRQSYLTGREIVVNLDQTRFLLSADKWSIDAGRRAFFDLERRWRLFDDDLRPSTTLAATVSRAKALPDLAAITNMMACIFSDIDDWAGTTEYRAYQKTAWKRRTDRTRV